MHPTLSTDSGKESSVITRTSVRLMENDSIRIFVKKYQEYLQGKVLDFGSGTEPYRDLVSGTYVPYEKGDSFPDGNFSAVLMNQVVQYLDDPQETFTKLAKIGEYLVMTYPTHWEEVEKGDLCRFTKAGMEKILIDSGYEILHHEPRWTFTFTNFELVGGYGVVARSTKGQALSE